MAKLYNLARMTTATTGTGTITLGSAVASYVTFALAGVQNGDTVTYAIVDGNNREVGRGVYTAAGTTLTRATILESTNANAAINLSGSAEVFITAAAEDITSNVEITGGSISGITDLAVADGGTGRSSSTAYALIAGGTTSTGPQQSVSGVGTSGQVLTSNGAGALPTWASPAAATGTLLRAPQILTSGTSYTTPAGCTRIYVEAVGGGAAGNTNGSGGGSGGYAAIYFTVIPSTSYTYAIGAGGTGSNGAAGGNTTFTVSGTTMTATGGSGVTGGTPTNGDVNIRGGNATTGSGTLTREGQAGAASFFGGGGGGGAGSGSTGGSGTNGVTGGGGGGAGSGTNSAGSRGSGGAGLIRIWEYA